MLQCFCMKIRCLNSMQCKKLKNCKRSLWWLRFFQKFTKNYQFDFALFCIAKNCFFLINMGVPCFPFFYDIRFLRLLSEYFDVFGYTMNTLTLLDESLKFWHWRKWILNFSMWKILGNQINHCQANENLNVFKNRQRKILSKKAKQLFIDRF